MLLMSVGKGVGKGGNNFRIVGKVYDKKGINDGMV